MRFIPNLKTFAHLIISMTIISCASSNHATIGWNYIEKKNYSEAKKEFELSLAKDTLPGSLSGMSKALEGLNEKSEAKKYLVLLNKKFPNHRFTPMQIESWNQRNPNDKIAK
jgi:hypothetical protein